MIIQLQLPLNDSENKILYNYTKYYVLTDMKWI